MQFSYCTVHWKTTQFVIELSLVTSESNYWNTISQNLNMSRTLLGSNSQKKKNIQPQPQNKTFLKEKGGIYETFRDSFGRTWSTAKRRGVRSFQYKLKAADKSQFKTKWSRLETLRESIRYICHCFKENKTKRDISKTTYNVSETT